MSSTYRVLCLSHDPALVAVDRDWQSGNGGLDRAVMAVQTRNDLDGHERCDLAIGRYSYPLVEVACPGGCTGGYHGDTPRWTNADVLRLLWCAYNSGDEVVGKATVAPEFRCWPRPRLALLREELGMP